ncbi:hypothetical protein MCC93_11420 [Morococcus cerebrosus]|uniref:Uncharacterized protein n=1 Tax=Morococcus cerebrosus TaxID=1056807 RepID=A0A0C1GQJ5_9NEIS|nr:hypothetical protein MCC93_11420 [Morococcus cerebrosus]
MQRKRKGKRSSETLNPLFRRPFPRLARTIYGIIPHLYPLFS